MSALEVLIRARGFIERGWAKYEYAFNDKGHPVEPNAPEATCWCSFGALRAACGLGAEPYEQPPPKEYLDALGVVIWMVDYSLDGWNDEEGRTKEEVLALFDDAIEKAQS